MYDGVSNSYLVIRFCEQNNNTTKKWVALYDNEEDYFYWCLRLQEGKWEKILLVICHTMVAIIALPSGVYK